MRLELITRNFLTSIFLFSLVYAGYVPHPTDYLSSTANVAAKAAVGGGDNSAVDQTMIANGPGISKRTNLKAPVDRGQILRVLGVKCGNSVYFRDVIEKVQQVACAALRKKNPSNLRQKMMSCAPNLPYCNYNFPQLYNGPPEIFEHRKPLYVWPIGTNPLRKAIGSKGNHRIVFDLDNECSVYGVIYKIPFGGWDLCAEFV